jgi:hypothetical protein
MQFHISIQNPAANRFTASVLGMPETWVVEGKTKAEALDRRSEGGSPSPSRELRDALVG